MREKKAERNICNCSKHSFVDRVSSVSMESAAGRDVEDMRFVISFAEIFPAVSDYEERKSGCSSRS